jgi:hypothetical protein
MVSRMRWFRRYPARHEHLAWSVIRTWRTVISSKLTSKKTPAPCNPSLDSTIQLINGLSPLTHLQIPCGGLGNRCVADVSCSMNAESSRHLDSEMEEIR